jgi:hypothetical protein
MHMHPNLRLSEYVHLHLYPLVGWNIRTCRNLWGAGADHAA